MKTRRQSYDVLPVPRTRNIIPSTTTGRKASHLLWSQVRHKAAKQQHVRVCTPQTALIIPSYYLPPANGSHFPQGRWGVFNLFSQHGWPPLNLPRFKNQSPNWLWSLYCIIPYHLYRGKLIKRRLSKVWWLTYWLQDYDEWYALYISGVYNPTLEGFMRHMQSVKDVLDGLITLV